MTSANGSLIEDETDGETSQRTANAARFFLNCPPFAATRPCVMFQRSFPIVPSFSCAHDIGAVSHGF